jgi:hypothetical protein
MEPLVASSLAARTLPVTGPGPHEAGVGLDMDPSFASTGHGIVPPHPDRRRWRTGVFRDDPPQLPSRARHEDRAGRRQRIPRADTVARRPTTCELEGGR